MSLLHLVPDLIRPLSAYAPPAEPPPVKLDANESPWPLPEEARRRIAEAVAAIDFHRYPDPRASKVRALVAERTGGSPHALVLGAGSDEVIALMMTALTKPRVQGRRAVVLFPEPTFVMFRISALAHGLAPVGVPLRSDWQLDVEAMRKAIAEHRPNLVFLATPNNPTGGAYADEDLRAVVESDPEALFVIDEAYGAFARRTLADWCDRHPNVAALGTLSKIGVAAARVGWARLPDELAVEVDKARQPYNLNTLSQRVAELALGELAPMLDELVGRVIDERKRLMDAVAALPAFEVHPSDANFFLARYGGDPSSLEKSLRAKGISIKNLHGKGVPLDHHVRITVGTPGENDRLLEALSVD